MSNPSQQRRLSVGQTL